MAQIPEYGGPQVKEDPLRLPMQSPEQPLSAFGGGEAAQGAFAQAGGIARDVQSVAQEEYHKQYQSAIQTEAQNASNAIGMEAIRIKQGLMQVKGRDAQRAADDVLGDFEKSYQNIEKGISNDDVKRQVHANYLQHQQGLYAFAGHYAAAEGKAYDQEVFTNGIKIQRDSASVDPSPANVAVASMSQKLAIKEYADKNGLPPEWVDQTSKEAASGTYLSALQSLAKGGMDRAARGFFDMNKDEFWGKDLVAAESLVKDSTYRGESQREVARIMDGKYTEKEMYAQVDKIEDPTLQDLVRNRLDDRLREKRRIDEDALKANIQTAADIIEGNPSLDAIPLDVFQALPLTARRALQNRARQIIAGEEPQPSGDRYLDLLKMSSDNPDEFRKVDMNLERGKMTAVELKELARDQIKPDEGKLRGMMSVKEIVSGVIREQELNAEDGNALRRAANRAFLAWRKKFPNEDISPEDAELLVDQFVSSDRRFFGLIAPKGLNIVKYEDIPKAERDLIEEELLNKRIEPSPGRVEDLYRKKNGK